MRYFWFLSIGATCVLLRDQMHSSLPTRDIVIEEVREEVGLRDVHHEIEEVYTVTRTKTTRTQQQPQPKTIGTTLLKSPALDQRSHEQEVVTLTSEKKSRIKPWETTPPTPMSFMNTTHDYIKRRHTCIKAIRARHREIFKDYLLGDNGAMLDVVLVDPAYHKNVGDHMLTLGEIRLIEQAFKVPHAQQCHYRQAQNFVKPCEEVLTQGGSPGRKSGKVALWHAGGNWGDIWSTFLFLLQLLCFQLLASFCSISQLIIVHFSILKLLNNCGFSQ